MLPAQPQFPSHHSHLPGIRVAAFSLVEVVLAMGMVSFAMVSILGLLTVGFSSSVTSRNQVVKAQIARAILGEAQLTNYSELETRFASTRFYDIEGKSAPGNPSSAQYPFKAAISFDAVPSLLGSNAHAKRLIIDISNQSNPLEKTKYSMLLVQNQ